MKDTNIDLLRKSLPVVIPEGRHEDPRPLWLNLSLQEGDCLADLCDATESINEAEILGELGTAQKYAGRITKPVACPGCGLVSDHEFACPCCPCSGCRQEIQDAKVYAGEDLKKEGSK